MLKAFVINLERRKDRLDHVFKNYSSNLYELEILKAYDGTHPENNSEEITLFKDNFLENISNNQKKTDEYKYIQINDFKKGELGCFVSHLWCWKKMIDENLPSCIIYEDDCIFEDYFNEKLSHILQELPKDYGICWLGGKTGPKQGGNNIQFSDNLSIKKEECFYGAFAYMLDQNYAKLLLDLAFDVFRGKIGVDFFICHFLQHNNYRQFVSNPFICYSVVEKDSGRIFDSDIQYS